MNPPNNACSRQFGPAHPVHVRLFTEHQGQYWLQPGENSPNPLSFEEYIAEEASQGYLLKSLTGIVNDTEKIRVITQLDFQEAARQKTAQAQSNQKTPIRLAIFEEDGHVYTGAAGPFEGVTLDQYLDRQAKDGYHLKQAVGLVEDSPGSTSRKIRVRTEAEPGKNTPESPAKTANGAKTPRFR